MINAIKVDLRKLLIGKTYLGILIGVGVIYPFAVSLFMKILSVIINEQKVLELYDFQAYSAYATFVIAFGVTKFFHSEFEDGALKNKLVSGKRRQEVFLSACFVSSVFAVILQILSTLAIFAFAWMTGFSMSEIVFAEVMEYTFVMVLAGISVSIFYTVIYMCHGNSRITVAVPMGISIFTSIILMYIMDKLYPQNGICKLTGTRLFIYQIIDKYSPFAYFIGMNRWSIGTYVIGSGLLVVTSLFIGLIIFQRKDLV